MLRTADEAPTLPRYSFASINVCDVTSTFKSVVTPFFFLCVLSTVFDLSRRWIYMRAMACFPPRMFCAIQEWVSRDNCEQDAADRTQLQV